jgi:Flp pilus assembly protein TadD
MEWKTGTGRFRELGLIVLVGAVAYSNTFGSPFAFDDFYNILKIEQIRDLSNFLSLQDIPLYPRLRLLGYFTLALNYWAHGFDVTGYHVVNLMIHIAAAFSVYFLVHLTFRTPVLKGSGISQYSNAIALFSALIFVSHPLQTQAVTYIVQRFASLATLLYLSALVLYIKARLLSPGLRSRAYLAASVVVTLLAMMTKEIAFTIPLTIAMYELFFLRGTPRARRSLAAMLPLLLFIPAQFLITAFGAGEGGLTILDSGTSYIVGISRTTYMITQLRVLVTYIRLVFLPFGQNLDYDYPVYDSLLAPPVLLSAAFLMAICALGVWLFIRSRRGEPALRIISFGIAWFFVTLSVESSVFPLDLIYEHRMYLPSAGVFIALATAGTLVVLQFSWRPAGTMAALFGTIVLIMTVATYSRNEVWRTHSSLWQDVVEKSPQKVRANYNLAVAYSMENRADEAIEQLEKTLSLDPACVKALKALGTYYEKQERIPEAIVLYERLLDIIPNEYKLIRWLGMAYYRTGKGELAIRYLEEALEHEPDMETLNNLGIIYKRTHEFEKSEGTLLNCIELSPSFAPCRFNLGLLYYENGFPEKAREAFLEALKLNPGYSKARAYLERISRE